MILSALLAAAAAVAQATPELPPLPSTAPAPPLQALPAPGWAFDSKRNLGVEFALPGGGAPTVGITYFVAEAVAARIDFGLDVFFSPTGTPALFNVALGVRFYQLKRERVAVFIAPSFAFGRARTATDAAEYIAFGGAAGVEYFFTDHLSAGGQLGLALALANLGGAANSSVITELSTNTSGLFAQIYF
jgi:hypothetical protein